MPAEVHSVATVSPVMTMTGKTCNEMFCVHSLVLTFHRLIAWHVHTTSLSCVVDDSPAGAYSQH